MKFPLLLLLLLPLLCRAQSPVVLPQHLRAEVDYMQPQRYQPRHVSDFCLELRGDTADVYLPYMGDVYMPTFDREGLNFTAPMQQVQRSHTKKGHAVLQFSVRRQTVVYTFRLTAYPDHTFDLHLRPSNAQDCWYRGYWDAPDVAPSAP